MFYKICIDSSKNLHNTMFSSLVKAPMRFFDTNSSGRILNRFTKDIGSVDEILPTTMMESLQIFAVMVGILAQVIIIDRWTILPMTIVFFFYARIRKIYIATATDLKRLEGVCKRLFALFAGMAGIINITQLWPLSLQPKVRFSRT